MITQLDLHTFKCFKELQLPLAPLTLLSGSNASGKSTVLQSLVLLHQTIRDHEWTNRLYLNGNTLSLGSVLDVVDKINSRDSFRITLQHTNESYSWGFRGLREAMTMNIDSLHHNGIPLAITDMMRYLIPYQSSHQPVPALIRSLQRLMYLTAERVGPRELYPLVESEGIPDVGPTGEHTASVLYQLRDAPVNPALLLDRANSVLRQVELRMQQFFPNSSIVVDRIAQRNFVTLGLRNSPETDYHRPQNVGFGLTQVLPIIVAALTAQQGDVLLIENPEVHLHPAGQALMGRFLAEVAQSGVQIILETHSDHILNGMRRAIKSGVIPHTDVLLYFFNPRYQSSATPVAQVINPRIDKHGNLDAWPAGFFDQFDKDTNYFAGWGE